jgi:glycosyltransferase involved in cell wall biosynthesis
MNRVSPELVSATAAERADLIYSGGGALLPAMLAARRLGVPYAVDLEDFHSGEQASTTGEKKLTNALAKAAEKFVFREAAFLTTASEAIADQYAFKYSRRPLVINNTFRLPVSPPDFSAGNGSILRLYWFGQTIGPRRGLEDCIRAAGVAGITCELHLRGKAVPEYFSSLRQLTARCAPKLTIIQHDPVASDDMVDTCRGMDVGLALEPGFSDNNALALSNKALTYILAGLAVIFTDTPGQRALARDLGAGAWLYSPGDVARLATSLKLWAEDPARLLTARKAAWDAACRRWHWGHPEEEGALLRAVETVLPR